MVANVGIRLILLQLAVEVHKSQVCLAADSDMI